MDVCIADHGWSAAADHDSRGVVWIGAEHEFLRSNAELEKLLATFTHDQLAREAPSWNTPSGFKSDVLIKIRPQRETLVRKTGGMTALLFAARDGQIERAVIDLAETALLANRVGEAFDAVVTDMAEDHVRIQLCDQPVVARVSASKVLPGERITVRLDQADPERRSLAFTRVS